MKKQDWYLIFLVLFFALASFAGFCFANRDPGEEAVVYVGEKELARFSLREETTYRIELEDGSYNQLVVREGEADVTEASCPDKVCVHQTSISETGETIVCMPNQVIVTVEPSTS